MKKKEQKIYEQVLWVMYYQNDRQKYKTMEELKRVSQEDINKLIEEINTTLRQTVIQDVWENYNLKIQDFQVRKVPFKKVQQLLTNN